LFGDAVTALGLRPIGVVCTITAAVLLPLSLMGMVGLAHGSRWVAKACYYLLLLLSFGMIVQTGMVFFRLHHDLSKALKSYWRELDTPTRNSIMQKVLCE